MTEKTLSTIQYSEAFEATTKESSFMDLFDAVVAGQLAMLRTTGLCGDNLLLELEEEAKRRNLLTVRYINLLKGANQTVEQITLFVLRDYGELWRVTASLTLQRLGERFSSSLSSLGGFRVFERALAGASDHEIETFLHNEGMLSVGPGLATLFFIVSKECLTQMIPLGGRSINPTSNQALPIVLFFKGKFVSLKSNYREVVPDDVHVARVGIKWLDLNTLMSTLVCTEFSEMVHLKLSLSHVPLFNSILQTNIELFNEGRWARLRGVAS